MKNHNLVGVKEKLEVVEEEVVVEVIRLKEKETMIKKQQRLILMIITHSPHCDENF